MPRLTCVRVGLMWVAITVNDNYEVRTARAFTQWRAIGKLVEG